MLMPAAGAVLSPMFFRNYTPAIPSSCTAAPAVGTA